MAEKPVMGEEALQKMAQRALNRPQSSSKGSDEEKDPLEEAQRFTKQMAASSIIESEVVKSKAAADKAKAEAEEAKTKAEKAKSGETGIKTPEPLVKVTGEMDFGKFNVQEMLQEQQNELKELKKEAEEQASSQTTISNDLREKLHSKEMEVLKTSFDAQIQMLGELIKQNASRGTFMDQYNMTKEMATQIGFAAPGAGAGNLQGTLELKKLEFEQTRDMRRLVREDKAEERRWQIELRKLDDDRDSRKIEQDRQKRKDDMFANAPTMIGSAIAKGIVDSEVGSGQVTQKPKGKTGHHVETGVGEGGEVDCPECQQPVAIGPTAKVGVCANCGTRLSIRRTGTETEAGEGEE